MTLGCRARMKILLNIIVTWLMLAARMDNGDRTCSRAGESTLSRAVPAILAHARSGFLLILLFGCMSDYGKTRAEPYVELSAEVDYFLISQRISTNATVSAETRRTNEWTIKMTCVVGIDEWEIHGPFDVNGNRHWYFDGTNVCLGLRMTRPLSDVVPELATNTSLQGFFAQRPSPTNQTVHIYHAPEGYLPGRFAANVAWLAFCSGTYLKREDRRVPLPLIDLRSSVGSFAYRDETSLFDDGLSLPRSVVLYRDREPTETNNVHPNAAGEELNRAKFRYRVLEITNVASWTFPLEFEFAADSATEHLNTMLMGGGRGRILSIGISPRPPGVFDSKLHQTVADFRFVDEGPKKVMGMTYLWTNGFVPQTNDPTLRAAFAARVASAPNAGADRSILARIFVGLLGFLVIGAPVIGVLIRRSMRNERNGHTL